MSASARPTGVRVRVPAKVNLHLGVGELRADGYHELINVFHAVDLYDEIAVRPGAGLTIRMTGEGADALPSGPENLAWRAASRLAAHHRVPAGAAIEIAKAIPVAGGMAGGSADAAGTLLACARLWGLDDAALPHLAAELGSDVAFPLLGGTAVGVGRGERLDPLPAPATLHWVFALADFGISSGAAYRELDRMRADGRAPAPAAPPDALRSALAAGDVPRIAAALHNELQPACLALAPSLRTSLDAGRRLGALAAIVSGSGPTCAFLCADADAAATLAGELAREGVCRTTRAASGPVAGATVLDG